MLYWSDSVMFPANPLMLVNTMLNVPEEPGRKEIEPGLMSRVKLVTTSGRKAGCVIEPLCPFSVTV